MPYAPSEKSPVPAKDRAILDPLVENLALEVSAHKMDGSRSLIKIYKEVFLGLADQLHYLFLGIRSDFHYSAELFLKKKENKLTVLDPLAEAIYGLEKTYGYEGACLGELNYPMTRFIQRVPQLKVKRGEWKDDNELRYWVYASTVEALAYAHIRTTLDMELGIGGVFEDVKDEYKWRVNRAYEIFQILKSGDCYDTPYYSRIIELVDEDGGHVGYQDVMMQRSESTLHLDLLNFQIVVRKKKKVEPPPVIMA